MHVLRSAKSPSPPRMGRNAWAGHRGSWVRQAGHTEIFRPKFGSHTAVAQELLKSSGEFWKHRRICISYRCTLPCSCAGGNPVRQCTLSLVKSAHCHIISVLSQILGFWIIYHLSEKNTRCTTNHVIKQPPEHYALVPWRISPEAKGQLTGVSLLALEQASVGVIAVATCLQHCISDFGAQECSRLLKHKKGLCNRTDPFHWSIRPGIYVRLPMCRPKPP